MDGATPLQLFRLVYLPLMVPSLVAVGTYALLLAWNEYLYALPAAVQRAQTSRWRWRWATSWRPTTRPGSC